MNLLTVEQVAERLSLTVRTVYGYIKQGKLPAVKFGRVYRIEEKELAEFINSCKT